ncbi:LrgB family protein [Azospirillum picis]|uniref:Murein hydrolase (TIGR00659 family) n=1 Tax=Azospirillum picis TaxID=488438 RepID=A0ABU0MUT9_9PROT|nr:LrgB family protein [Azospirillum picis]MBP2301873.1 putative murein hydrolase (TIGR00659 family) [Azospirillum picis]MDQ0537225.1 putative murein hydrolase (TIGR00659 family) [Azospirillum picis]
MALPIPLWDEPLAQAAVWSAVTIGFYVVAKRLYRWRPVPWLMPLLVTPAALILVALALHVSYRDYIRGTGWLIGLLGPATVAFALPIYEQRAVIRRHWPVLAVGMLAGSTTAFLTGWALSTLLGLDGALRLSLLPRSISTPFAMTVSGEIGGIPDLTAVFVVVTGVLGAVFGELLLAWLPVRTALARGALFGVGAHGAGTAKALEIGREEGSIAGLVMVLVGLLNVLAAPAIAHYLGS